MEYKFVNNNGIVGTAKTKTKAKQHRIRTYNRKIEIIPKDKNIRFRVTTAQDKTFRRILEQRGITITDYFTKIIENEIQKDMNKNQIEIFETDLK